MSLKTKAYRTKMKQLRSHNGGPVPAILFKDKHQDLHALFIPDVGLPFYQVSNSDGVEFEFRVQDAVFAVGWGGEGLHILLKHELTSSWTYLSLIGRGSKASIEDDAFVLNFKKTHFANTQVGELQRFVRNYLK